MKVGFLGPKGTFTEEASRRYFAGQEVEWMQYPSIIDVLNAVREHEVDHGVVPIENSIEGSVTMTLDGLAKHEELFVEAEIVIAIEQNLLVHNQQVGLDDIKEIWSHPQALAQCREFVHQLGVAVQTHDSTAAAAAELAKLQRTDVAAIGTTLAADMFGLHVLQHSLQDHTENYTRFVVVRNGPYQQPHMEKTILLVSLDEDRPGALVHVLNLFAAVGLNLSRIESRPTRKKLGTYQFFIDVEAGLHEDSVQKVLSMVETAGHSIRVLGSYSHKRQKTASNR